MAMLSRAGDWDTRITTCNIGGRPRRHSSLGSWVPATPDCVERARSAYHDASLRHVSRWSRGARVLVMPLAATIHEVTTRTGSPKSAWCD